MGAWFYPLRGILHFLTSRRLWKPVAKFGGAVSATSLASIIVWFKLTFPGQFKFFAHLFGVGWFNHIFTTIVVLVEASGPVYLVFHKQYKRLQRKLFRTTLQGKGVTVSKVDSSELRYIVATLLTQQQQAQAAAANSALPVDLASRAAKLGFKLLIPSNVEESKLLKLTRATITLPLKISIPILVPVFAYFEGYSEATVLMSQYWVEKGLESEEAQRLVADAHLSEYRSFGAVASVLEYIPVLTWVLGLTNSVGAALWAADMERAKKPLLKGL